VDNRLYLLHTWIWHKHVVVSSPTQHRYHFHRSPTSIVPSRKGLGELHARVGVHYLRQTGSAQSWTFQYQRALSDCGWPFDWKPVDLGCCKCKLRWRGCVRDRHHSCSKSVLRSRFWWRILRITGYLNSMHRIRFRRYYETIPCMACCNDMAVDTYQYDSLSYSLP
jgi:hypothetical protein